MTISRSTRNALRMTVLGVLLAGFATLGIAQQARPAKGPPVTTKGAVQSAPKADKGQATAQAARIESRQRMAVKNADRLRNKEQVSALKLARGEPWALRRGIRLGPDRSTAMNRIESRYFGDLTALEARARTAERAGQADPSVVARIEEMRRRERTEMRDLLLARDQARFDRNVTAYVIRLP